MRDHVGNLDDGDCTAPFAIPAALGDRCRALESILGALLQPFRRQLITVRSVVVIGPQCDDAALYKIVSGGLELSGVLSSCVDATERYSLESLRRRVHQTIGNVTGDDLLVIQDANFEASRATFAGEIGFRAISLLPSRDGQPGDGWRLQQELFDRGLVNIGSVQLAEGTARCYLQSDAIHSFPQTNDASRGEITMATLGLNGGFANQLFQYAYVKLYALRHQLTAKFPYWQGRELYDLHDPLCGDVGRPQLSFNGFADDDLRLWEADSSPINIDLWGYFQETPECWRRHRALLRRMFSLRMEWHSSIECWRNEVTRGGERSFVALHVRRGDYRKQSLPYFQLIPEERYLDWLRQIWPTLDDPVLFVATDEPDNVLPYFEEFSPVYDIARLRTLPAHIRDFEILRRADYLAICNSSYSRMAAILAPDTQRCFLPSRQTESFEPYEPWIDPGFWVRFSEKHTPKRISHIASETRSAIYVDVTDLLLYFLGHTTPTGIQRVQCEVIHHLADTSGDVSFTVLNNSGNLCSIDSAELLDFIEVFSSAAYSSAQFRQKVRSALSRAHRLTLHAGDVFLTIGAFWGVRGMGRLLLQLKNSGTIIGLFVHDIIPITHPEYFRARDTRVFLKAMMEALTFADFVLTSSLYNKRAIDDYCGARQLTPIIEVIPLAHQFTRRSSLAPEISVGVKEILESEFVLCVGTIEVRKNPTYLFHIWKLMAQSGRATIPKLVFAGRRGWLIRDFVGQLESCNYLDGNIVIVSDATDAELDLLYQECLLTVFPSFAEGWGLPVGESLAHGKISICTAGGATAEAGASLADYVDPYNVRSGFDQLLHYLDNPDARRRREEKIVECFEPRSWREVAEDVLASTRNIARQIQPSDAVAAITLPPNKFMPIAADAGDVALSGEDGSLSAELACMSGWWPPQALGVWAGQQEAMLRFRTELAPGSRVHLLARLASEGSNCRVRIASALSAQTTVAVGGERDVLATLSCEVDENGLVTALFSLDGQERLTKPGRPYWCLKGFMYVEPQALRRTQASICGDRERVRTSADERSMGDRDRVRLRDAPATEGCCQIASLGAFLEAKDACWSTTPVTTDREPPIFGTSIDERIFYTRYRNSQSPPLGEISESATLVRRSEQYLSTSRFSEGVIFDPSGVRRGFSFLKSAPLSHTPWLMRGHDGITIDSMSLSKAPRYEGSHLIFYNGNLHNYYHWLAEGLLCLDVLMSSIRPARPIRLALPQSMDINPLIDHRASLGALGFDNVDIVEVGEGLIQVEEALWIECDLVERLPAPYLKRFQQRIATKYLDAVCQRSRRLLIERRGPTRKIGNFDEVRAYLGQEGFETISLEGMAPKDQILLFRSAEFVIGAHGAALTNLLFCEPGTKVLEFMPEVEMRPFFWLISGGLNLRHAVQFCSGIDGDTFQATLEVDIGKLKTLYRKLICL